MPLEREIVEKIEQMFSPDDARKAIELLSTAGQSGRVARCIVFTASSNLERLRRCLELAERDYRDAIMAGEYSGDEHVRDFRASFLIDAPVKMWISEVAAALARRDYFLSSIETDPANGRMVKYHEDSGEGSATFEGDLGKIYVIKNRGQWFLKGDQANLQAYGLTRAFDDKKAFIDAVSG